jgi:hypothetical protein
MRLVIHAAKVNHAIQACKRRALTTASVGVELLLGEDVAAVLIIYAPSAVCSMFSTLCSSFGKRTMCCVGYSVDSAPKDIRTENRVLKSMYLA